MILPTALNSITTTNDAVVVTIVESAFTQRIDDDCCSLSNAAGVNFTIYQGETIVKSYGLADNSVLDGWSCRVQIRSLDKTELLFDNTLTNKSQDNTKFLLTVPSLTTETFQQGYYVIAAELVNYVSGENNEIVEKFEVLEQWVY